MKLVLLALALSVVCGCNDRRTTDTPPPPPVDSGAGTDSSTGMDSGGSVLDPSRTVDSLNLAESRMICEPLVAAQGGPRMVNCDGLDVRVQTVDECAASIDAATCTRTVGELNACADALGGDPCLLFTAPACMVLAECGSAG